MMFQHEKEKKRCITILLTVLVPEEKFCNSMRSSTREIKCEERLLKCAVYFIPVDIKGQVELYRFLEDLASAIWEATNSSKAQDKPHELWYYSQCYKFPCHEGRLYGQSVFLRCRQ
jgi:hypothetical protein